MFRPWTKVLFLACLLILSSRWWYPLSENAFALAMLPLRWRSYSADSIISEARDNFDITFANYPANQSAHDDSLNPIPPILHHIHLGNGSARPEWLAARADCLRYHENWEVYLWNDSNAGGFVQENYPHLKKMWDSYRYPVQRVDALRFMVLFKFGGVVLDLDLACKRSLEPLRKFDFVAPAAHPTGFSIGMLLASPNNPFIGELVRNLPIFNRAWFFLPYATVMFSTGCHYASTIFTLQGNRRDLRILAGPSSDPRMHTLNGDVNTPLFRHLGTSSWHDFDAVLINSLGHLDKCALLLGGLLFAAASIFTVCAIRWICRHRRPEPNIGMSPVLDTIYKDV